MIRKIILSNFMAHEHSEVELADGLNVLVGPNNIGKSTIALALKILARNSNANFVLQHDQKECSVEVETSEGHSIRWIKRKSPSYVINGQIKDRLGRGNTPPELDETLRLAPVEFEDKDFEPHFGEQKSPIFLIHRSPSQIAQFFSTTSDAEKLVSMQKLHQRQRLNAQTQFKLLSDQNKSIETLLDCLSDVPDIDEQVIGLEKESDALQALETQIRELSELIREYSLAVTVRASESLRLAILNQLPFAPTLHSTEYIESVIEAWELAQFEYHYLSDMTDSLSHLPGPLVVDDTSGLSASVISWHDQLERLEHSRSGLESLACLTSPPTYESTEELSAKTTLMEELEFEQARLEQIQRIASHLQEPPQVELTEPLREHLQVHVQTQTDFEASSETGRVLEHLEPIGKEVDTEPLRQFVDILSDSIAEVQNTENAWNKVKLAWDAFEKQTTDWLETDPVCHTCGTKLSRDNIRYPAHQHA